MRRGARAAADECLFGFAARGGRRVRVGACAVLRGSAVVRVCAGVDTARVRRAACDAVAVVAVRAGAAGSCGCGAGVWRARVGGSWCGVCIRGVVWLVMVCVAIDVASFVSRGLVCSVKGDVAQSARALDF